MFSNSNLSYLRQLNDKWVDYETFKRCLESYAARKGFSITKHSTNYFRCNRFGIRKQNGKERRKFNGGDLKCGCTFQIGLRPSSYIKKTECNSVRNYRHRPNFDRGQHVTVMKADTEHAGGCKPSPANQVMTKNRSGRYISQLTDIAMFQLCNAVLKGNRLNTPVSKFRDLKHSNISCEIFVFSINI